MSVVVLATAQSRAGDAVTQDMIDGVEADAAAVVGPLTGERTETFYLSDRRDMREVDGLWLSRRTDGVTLTSDGDTLTLDTDYRLINGLLIERISDGATWGDTLIASYTPTDEDSVTEMLYDLLTVRTLNPKLQSVRIGAYSETYATGQGGLSSALLSIYGKVKPSLKLGRYASPFRYRANRVDRTLVEAVES